jgi:hypothetical protein
MVTQLLDRVPVDRISAEARQVNFGRLLLTLLVGVFWLLGWLAGKASLGLAFCWAAVKIGWTEARTPSEAGPRVRAP